MAIQVRRGPKVKFDPRKMLPGEWAVSTDPETENQIVWMCFQAGVVKRMGTYEDFRAQIAEATEDIRTEYAQSFDEIKEYMEGLKADTEGYKNTASSKATAAANSANAAQRSASSAEGYKNTAVAKATESASSAATAKISETNSKASETASKESEKNAANSATASAGSAADASDSADTARTEAGKAAAQATAAKVSADTAKAEADKSAASATASAGSADTAAQKADEASASAEDAEEYSEMSRSYAVGTGNVARPSDETDNSRAYSELAQRLVEEAQKLLDQAQKIVSAATAGSLIPAGTITFSELPEEPKVGYMYNISNDFTTDTRFAEGPGVFYRAGANVYWSKDGQWDVMVGVQVTGVKGEAESEYRFGNVNITKANMGLANAENTADADKKVANAATLKDSGDGKDITAAYSKAGLDASNWLAAWSGYELRAISPGNIAPAFTQATTRENLTTKEKISIALGKISKWFADLKPVAFSGAYSDLSGRPGIGNGTVTIKQNGTSKGSFTMNQSGNTEIELTDSDTKYTLPLASTNARGGVKTGYSANDKNYPVQLDSGEKMYVNVPWTDTNTTYSAATTSAAGLMSAADKAKLNGIAAGAQVNPTSLPANGGTSDYTNYMNANNIPANANLNSYTTPGFYYCPANSTVATFTSCPTKNAFFMIVGKHAGTYQEVIEYMTASPKRFMRNLYNGAWGSWYRVYTTADAPPDTNTTYGNMKGATTSAAGAAGLAPAPAAGAANRYLRSDGTWQVPPDNNTVYTHPTTAGNKHIPAGGAAGQFLKWSAAGTAVWASLVNNLLATVAGSPLDATQGKVLDDKITALNGKLSEFYAKNSTNISFTPKHNCNALVTYESDGWGYAGGLWQLDVNATSSTKPTKAAAKRAVFEGHDSARSYGKGWSYFTGLKGGVAYTFARETYAGQGGGESNVIMTIQTFPEL
ncbi:MAG: hypothetical protein K1W22_12200 [Lachnospiraceae bacterium]